MKKPLLWIAIAGTVGMSIALLAVFSTSFRSLLRSVAPYAVFLLCPIMMLFMHRDHGGKRNDHDAH